MLQNSPLKSNFRLPDSKLYAHLCTTSSSVLAASLLLPRSSSTLALESSLDSSTALTAVKQIMTITATTTTKIPVIGHEMNVCVCVKKFKNTYQHTKKHYQLCVMKNTFQVQKYEYKTRYKHILRLTAFYLFKY